MANTFTWTLRPVTKVYHVRLVPETLSIKEIMIELHKIYDGK